VTHGLDERSKAILALVSEHPDGIKAADVADALDIDRPQATTYLTRLYDSDRITKLSRGTYAPIAKSVISVISDPAADGPEATQISLITGMRGGPSDGPNPWPIC
jgi:hypothetical protein